MTDEIKDLETVLMSEAGRRVIWRILERCGVFTPSYQADGAEQSAHREGRRAIGLDLLMDLEQVGPATFLRLHCEAADRARAARELAAKESAEAES